MASKLLKVLTEIEQGRQECIRTLHEKGSYILDANASFEDINDAIEELSVVAGQPYVEIPGEPNVATLNSQNDPDLWRRPANWPDIQAIIDEQENIVEDDYTYTPVGIALFLNDTSETTNFRFITTGNGAGHNREYNRNDLATGDFIVGTSYMYNSTVNDSYDQAAIVKTSDEKSYTFRNTGTWQDLATLHTWDTSKDIRVGDDTFRYVIVFLRIPQYHYDYDVLDYTHVPNIVEVSYFKNRISNTHINISLDTVHFIQHVPTHYTGEDDTSRYYINYSNSNNPECYKKTKLRKITMDRSSALPNANDYQTFYQVDTLDCPNVALTINTLQYYYYNVLYMRCKYFDCFYNDRYNANTNSYFRIRYVVVADTEYQEQYYSNVAGLVGLNSILEENFTQYIKGITISNYNYYAIQGAFEDRGFIELPELLTVTGSSNSFRAIRAKHVYIPKMTTAPDMSYEGGITELTVGCSTIPSTVPPTLKKLHLLGYTNGSLTQPISCRLTYLDLPNATGLDSDIQNFADLKYLKLPLDFKFNVPFTDNNKYINKQCILDLFRDCATLEEGESYTITIPKHLKSVITPEEIAVATNKGWTVTA